MIFPKVSAGFWAITLLIGWYDLELAAAFLAAIIIHEIGHLVVLRICNVSIYDIRLKLNGAKIHTDQMELQQELSCALAGPVASGLLGALLLRNWSVGSFMSFGLGLLNLMPLYPLDGGRITYAVLFLIVEEATAERVMRYLSFGVAGALMIGACWCAVWLQAGLWPIFAALVLLWRTGETEK